MNSTQAPSEGPDLLAGTGSALPKEIAINATPQETRVALLENKVLAELYIEYVKDRRVAGSIYKGRVVRVLPGMQAAFVDIGLEKAAFLYVSDVKSPAREYAEMFGLAHEEDEEEPFPRTRVLTPIEDLLQEGQEVLVQVSKEPLGRKGARITQYVSLPGRNVVYLPDVNHIGVSRRITDEAERSRLRDLLAALRKGGGYIVRTAAEGCSSGELEPEIDFLTRLWEEIQKKAARVSAPNLIHSDLDVTFRSVRDLYTPDVQRIVVDSPEEYRKLLDFVGKYVPQAKPAVELYSRPEPIFDFYGVEIEISKALERKVWLKSGGYIVIEMTEALTAIDVNTGSYVGKRNLEETILKTNLEAAREIAYQLRLRNIGGIIILDFIDMEQEENRRKVFESFAAELKKDRAKTNLLEISSLGLIEMTRKRIRENLGRTLCEPCPYCEGKGYVRSRSTVAYELFRELRRRKSSFAGEEVVVLAHPDVVSHLYEEERASLEDLERGLGRRISLRARPDYHQEDFEVLG